MHPALFALVLSTPMLVADDHALAYAPAPADNPLKGLVPYRADVRALFPHSLEFAYLPLSALMKGPEEFDWGPLETMLADVASRGHQAVFRVYLEYPGKVGAIPEFLVRGGLRVHARSDDQSQPPARVETPDYEDEHLRRALCKFIAALGARCDGDPRLGFLTAGLLGVWGEWHCYPRPDLFASRAVQAEVMDAYEAAFKVTPVLLRYPVGETTDRKAPNADRRFGYHDDSFAWATLATGRRGDEWFYLPSLKAAGAGAVDKWKTRPIGGEIRPEAWGVVFDETPGNAQIQDFRSCVEQTHATWLMDSGMFDGRQPADRVRRAEAQVRRMGYEFHVPTASIGAIAGGKLAVELRVENRGVAPFYHDWKPEYGLIRAGRVSRAFPGVGKLVGLLPGDPPRAWRETLDVAGTPPGRYRLAVRVPNPLGNGHPLRFANAAQDADALGWLTLGGVEVE